MSDSPSYTQADLERLPDLVSSKQAAEVLGVKSSALRMMVRRGALDPPTTVGTTQAWYRRDAVIHAWWRRQPENILRLAVTTPKEAEQTGQDASTEAALILAETTSPAALLREMMQQIAARDQAQAEAIALLTEQSTAQQIATGEKIESLTAAVQTLTQTLAEQQAQREAEHSRMAQMEAELKAERDRNAPFWQRLWGGGKKTDGS